MSDRVTLYDLSHKGETNTCWSYNVWKTRMVLNYKQVPYTTEWVDNTTLVPTLKSLGLPPLTSGGFEYTVPTVKFHVDGFAVMDSDVIASKIEEVYYPSPSLRLDPDLEAEANQLINNLVPSLFPNYLPRVVQELIPEHSKAKFLAPREEMVGMTIGELETKGGEQAWKATEPGFADLAAFIKMHKKDEGPFVLGSEVSYVDFILVPLFQALKDAGDDMFERAVGMDPSFRLLYEACGKWLKKND